MWNVFADLNVCFILISELEIKAQKENFEKQSDAIKSDAEVKLAELQALLEAERDRYKIEVTCMFSRTWSSKCAKRTKKK